MKEKESKSASKTSFEYVVGKRPNPVWNIVVSVGLIAVAVGTLLPILNAHSMPYDEMSPLFKYIFGVGAVAVLVARIFSTYKGKVLRLKRLYRIEMWSALFFCVATFFLFYEPDSTRNWIAFTLAGAVIQIYTSFMIPRTERRAYKGEVE